MSVTQVPGNQVSDIEKLEQIKLHKKNFYEILEAENLEGELIDTKGNKCLVSKEGYAQLMDEIQNAKLKKTTKTSREIICFILMKFLILGGFQRLLPNVIREIPI